MTKAQRNALDWLRAHNGTGLFDRQGVLLAAGDRAPFMRSTWNALRDAGQVAIFRTRPRGPHRVVLCEPEVVS